MTMSPRTSGLLHHLASRPGHDEVKADFRQLLIEDFQVSLDALEFERRVPEVRGRLDALIGRTIFEAKSDLDREWSDVERRMPDYLAGREQEEKEHFIGIASDGLKWAVFELVSGRLVTVKRTILDPERPGEFLAWLDGALALKSSLPPDALTIRSELGQGSVAYHLARERLGSLWEELKVDGAVSLKRQLWAVLLEHVYGRAVENDELWFQHTFLVIVAKCIAVAVMGLPEDDPKRLLSGEAFAAAGINGAVESDFFDWIIAGPDGEVLMRQVMNHVRRFRLAEVESDVLKVLYESLIDRDERHGLGEYYTPDWLAAKVVRHAVVAPLEQRVLDPACGSGTFLFHAIRNFLAEARQADLQKERWAAEVCAHVAGTDIHPVAVIIARVTYLLALAPALASRHGSISIPVYLGDAMQLSITELMARKELTIHVPPADGGGNSREQLDFPEAFCRDPALFDKAIERMRMASLASLNRQQLEAVLYQVVEQHYRADPTSEYKSAIHDLGKTYVIFDKLCRTGRDTVWAYVARNLSRPLALSASGGWAHVVIGNPPWVAFRHMSADLQKRFKTLATGERVYVGGKFATQNDLCALFTVRAASLYLRSGGRLAFVLPMAVLTRGQFEPLRKGSFETVRIAWDAAWTMDDSVAPLFPVPSCVLFGRRRAVAAATPQLIRSYSGALPLRDATEALADARLTVTECAVAPVEAAFVGGSSYRKPFRQGATLVPRMLCMVERKQMGRLGVDPSAPYVTSRRSALEKMPWKQLGALENRVEALFLRPVLLGESVLPFQLFRPFEGVVPVDAGGRVLDAEAAATHGFDGLHGWMRKAEAVWNAYNASRGMTLVGRWNYHNELGAQFPIAPLRVVYAKGGTQPASCLLRDPRAVIDHMLYWMAPASEAEGHYLIAVLNSETTRARAAQFQARGRFGARHFDKVMFNLPIPRFAADNPLHRALAEAAVEAEEVAGRVVLPEQVKFQRARGLVRAALAEVGIAARIDRLVAELLDKE